MVLIPVVISRKDVLEVFRGGLADNITRTTDMKQLSRMEIN